MQKKPALLAKALLAKHSSEGGKEGNIQFFLLVKKPFVLSKEAGMSFWYILMSERLHRPYSDIIRR